MQRMPNIKLTAEEYRIMIDYCRLARGGEGIVCKGMRPDTLYKIFVDFVFGNASVFRTGLYRIHL
jgi:hypothetical protein